MGGRLTTIRWKTLWAGMLLVCLLGGIVFADDGADPMGVEKLREVAGDLTGMHVNLAMVELSEATSEGDDQFAFMPNRRHRALNGAYWRGVYCYQDSLRYRGHSPHATAIAGILFGYDEAAECDGVGAFGYQGLVPDAMVDLYETNWFIYKRVLAQPETVVNHDVVSMSWGTDSDDAITLWWQRGVDAMAAHQGIVIVAGSGNGGEQAINKPGWGYNVISVGAAGTLGGFPDSLERIGPPRGDYSSYGPTGDGRCKPDLIASGFCLAPATDSVDGYQTVDAIEVDKDAHGYSSFATPQVAGIAGLLIDAARVQGFAGGDDPRVIKALLMNGANKLVGWHKGMVNLKDDDIVPLDYHQGAGLVNAYHSYEQLMAGRYDPNALPEDGAWDLNQVVVDLSDMDNERLYSIGRPLGEGETFTATLCWYRPYEEDGVFNPGQLTALTLELWSVDEEGILVEMLDSSESVIDTVQHIYYTSDVEQDVVLIVSTWENDFKQYERFETPVVETYGLAFTAGQENWAGDRYVSDINADGVVEMKDLVGVMNRIMAVRKGADYSGLDQLAEDLNGDGVVDEMDLGVIAGEWHYQSSWGK